MTRPGDLRAHEEALASVTARERANSQASINPARTDRSAASERSICHVPRIPRERVRLVVTHALIPLTAREIAMNVLRATADGATPTKADVQTVRTQLHRLKRAGLVEPVRGDARIPPDSQCVWRAA